MKAGVGYSVDGDSRKAGREAAGIAMRMAGPPVLAIVFTTDAYDASLVLEGAREVLRDSRIVGFCGAGIVTSAGMFRQGVGVCAIAGDSLRVATTLQRNLSEHPRAVGEQAGAALQAAGIEKGVVLALPDGFQANLSDMLRGLYHGMGHAFAYAGGGAGDNVKFFKTYQFTDQGVASDALAAAALDGLEIATAIGHGWTPIGDPIVITRAEKKRVIEIDGVPAFTAYSRRLDGVSAADFPRVGMRHPLGFPDIAGNYLIRDPLNVNEDGSIDFVTEVPHNAVGNIMEGRMDDLLATAASVARNAVRRVKDPSFVLLFDCISRCLLMGDDFGREIELIRHEAGGSVPILGALTFGEVGSYGDVPLLHNKTVVALAGGGAR